MNEERIKEIETRLTYYFGTPRHKPIKSPQTAEEWEEIEALSEELEALQKQNGIIAADNYFLSVSKLAKNEVALINGNGGALQIDKKKNLYVRVEVGADSEIDIPEKYSGYMDAIQMTIGSLLDCGARVVTAEQVYRTMNGLTTADKVTPQAVGAVTRAIKQMRNLWITIDRTEEVNAYTKLKGQLSVIEQKAILPYNSTITVKNQVGRSLTGYKIDDYPPFYQYSKDRGEIRELPADIMKIEGLNSSKQIIAIKFYLLQQIESMKPGKNGKHRDNTININTLFNALKYDLSFAPSNPRKDRAKYIKYVKQILTDFKRKDYILDFKENTGGRGNALESITIFLPGKI